MRLHALDEQTLVHPEGACFQDYIIQLFLVLTVSLFPDGRLVFN